jgi:Ni,Fe-hydrogenase III small subunit
MNITNKGIYQKIRDDITQLEVDLDKAIKKIMEVAGCQIEPEKQTEAIEQIEATKQLLESFKRKYF